jgi:hypothetical protein
VKRVAKTCHDDRVFTHVETQATGVDKNCFAKCPQPLDRKGKCWTTCFYDAVLGPMSNSTAYPAGSGMGMATSDLEAAWVKAFADVFDGGCPAV